MADIRVARSGPEQYRVEVSEGESTTVHEVGASDADVERLGAGAPAEALIEESFRFLLEREPQGSILSSFHLLLIARYFPEYLEEIPERMKNR